MSRRRRVGLGTAENVPGPGRLGIPSAGFPLRFEFEWRWHPEPTWPTFERTTVPPSIDERGSDPLLTFFTVDDSGSEVAADPDGYRMVAGRRIAHLLNTSMKNKADLIGVTHFCEYPQPWLAPTSPHTRRGRALIRNALRTMNSGGGTDILAALNHTASLIPRGWKGQVVNVLLSDGEDGSSPEQIAAAVRRFPPGAVHLISISTEPPDAWHASGLGSLTVVPGMARPDEVEWIAGHAVFSALGIRWNGPDEPPAT